MKRWLLFLPVCVLAGGLSLVGASLAYDDTYRVQEAQQDVYGAMQNYLVTNRYLPAEEKAGCLSSYEAGLVRSGPWVLAWGPVLNSTLLSYWVVAVDEGKGDSIPVGIWLNGERVFPLRPGVQIVAAPNALRQMSE